jgi:molybdenum cofactor cytidylyltransferase
MKIGAIILAAGSSRRFGEDKRKSILDTGKSVLATTIGNVASHFDQIMVVLRFGDLSYANALGEELNYPGITYYCAPDSAQGMAHSLGNAIATISRAISGAENWDAAAIFLGDMPYLQSGTVQLLLETFDKSPKTEPIVVPVREGSYGHPVIFHHRYFQEITELKGDTGARSVIQAHLEHIIEVPTKDPGIERDIDLPEEMEPPKG